MKDHALVAAARSALAGRTFGAVRVITVEGTTSTDHDGDPVFRLRLTLTNPPTGKSTWDLADIHEVQDAAERVVADRDLSCYMVTEFYPQDDSKGSE